MTNKDEIAKLIIKFCYDTKDVYMHSYPDNDTFEITKFISFKVNGTVKHMRMLEIKHDMTSDEVFDISIDKLTGNDGMFLWCPSEIILFNCNKVVKAINDYESDIVPVHIVDSFFNRININNDG